LACYVEWRKRWQKKNDTQPFETMKSYAEINERIKTGKAILLTAAGAMDYVGSFNVRINTLGKGITRDRDACAHCGHCLPHCPTGALCNSSGL